MDNLKVSPEVELLLWMEFFVDNLRGEFGPIPMKNAIKMVACLEDARRIWNKQSIETRERAQAFMRIPADGYAS